MTDFDWEQVINCTDPRYFLHDLDEPLPELRHGHRLCGASGFVPGEYQELDFAVDKAGQ
jgi:hypothetical protein